MILVSSAVIRNLELCLKIRNNIILTNHEIKNLSHFLYTSPFSQCKNDPKSGNGSIVDPSKDPKAGVAFAVNLLGNKLQEWNDSDSIKQTREAFIEQSRNVYLGKLDDPKGYIQYGRAFVANGQVENGIELYSKGIEKFPEVADLYLYRGEAMLLGRQLTAAIDNFWKSGQKWRKSAIQKVLLECGVQIQLPI